MNRVLQVLSESGSPMTVAEINAATGGNWGSSVTKLTKEGRLKIVGHEGRKWRYAIPNATPPAAPTTLHEYLDVPREPEEPVNDTSFQCTPIAIKPAPSGRVWMGTDLALKLISLALSQPSMLTDDERRLIADAIHSTSDQLP